MSGWINLATTFPRHPKALAAGPAARHLFIVGLCWAGEYDTDGAIPGYVLNSLAIDAGIAADDVGQTADRLVEVGLWVRNADGWQVHDWGQWQSTSAEREERRSKNRERQANWRARQAKAASEQVSDGGPFEDGHDVSDASRNALVTAPKSKSKSTPKDLSTSLLVPSPGTAFGSGLTDLSGQQQQTSESPQPSTPGSPSKPKPKASPKANDGRATSSKPNAPSTNTGPPSKP
jgi:hypothetical protein